MRALCVAALAAVSMNCGGDDCGPHGASAVGLFVQNDAVKLTFGGLEASPNHDCPDDSAPNVESLTIQGVQTDGSGAVTFCIPRPDKLTSDEALGDDIPNSTIVHIVDLRGIGSDSCPYTIDQSAPPTGSMKADGICDNGANNAGFALSVDGDVSMKFDTMTATQLGSAVGSNCMMTGDFSLMITGTVQVVRGHF